VQKLSYPVLSAFEICQSQQLLNIQTKSCQIFKRSFCLRFANCVRAKCPFPKYNSNLGSSSSNFKLSISLILSKTARAFPFKLEANATAFTASNQALMRAIKLNCVKNFRRGTIPSNVSSLNLISTLMELVLGTQNPSRDAELSLITHAPSRIAKIIRATYLRFQTSQIRLRRFPIDFLFFPKPS